MNDDDAPGVVSPPGEDEIISWLAAQLAELSGVAADDLDLDAPISSYGLSSRDAVALSGELEEWLHCSLSPTLLWEYPTIRLVARHLAASA